MILKSAHIKNFRSIRDVTISFEKQTAIVGANGAGKSTVLKALEKFYASTTQITLDDFHVRNINDPIEIALTFTAFSPAERSRFTSRISNEEMTVVRVFEAKGGRTSGRYYGVIKGHSAFQPIRQAENPTTQRKAYAEVRATDAVLYSTLTPVRRADEIEALLNAWEAANPALCAAIRDDGQFLGFTNVGNGSLKKSTSFVFIPAVRDATQDALDGRNSAIARLMEMVVRSAIQRRVDIQTWQASTSAQYRRLTSPENLTELNGLAESLTSTLRTLYDETAVGLTWKPAPDFEVPLPTALVSLEDAGYEAPVELQGNGLQRAFILTLLQHLATATLQSDGATAEQVVNSVQVIETLTGNVVEEPLIPGLILAIEEPELYQHPTKQRHFAKVLSLLADGTLPGVASETQVILASHSQYFVCMDRFEQVRLARRSFISQNGGNARECSLCEANLADVLARIEVSRGVPHGTWSLETLRSRLHIITPELSEGFFADVVLLVEGESDKAAFRAAASTNNIDLEALGIAVLHAGGKTNLDRPAAIFRALGIPVFVVWDCDRKGSVIEEEACNRALQRLFDVPESEIFSAADSLRSSHCCFERNLEYKLQEEFGSEAYAEALAAAVTQFGLSEKRDAIKSAAVMKTVFSTLITDGRRSDTLDSVISRVVAMKGQFATSIS